MQLYLVRHGQSTHNANEDNPHNPDPPLTQRGHEQARLTGEALRAENLGEVALYASPMRRALQTASYIEAALGQPTHIIPDICEAGGLQQHTGMCRADILREWPTVTLDERIGENGWWTAREVEEEETAFYARAEQAICLLRERHTGENRPVVVVTHGRFGSALISTLQRLGPAGYSRFPFENCGISRIDFDPYAVVAPYPPPAHSTLSAEELEATRVRFHNRLSHLPPALIT